MTTTILWLVPRDSHNKYFYHKQINHNKTFMGIFDTLMFINKVKYNNTFGIVKYMHGYMTSSNAILNIFHDEVYK